MAALEIENKLMAREATQVQGKKGGGTDSIQQPLSRGTFGGNFPLCGFLVAQMVKKKKICLQCRRPKFEPWVRKIPWSWEWLPILVFLPGEFHGQRSLVGYSLGSQRVRHD